MAETVDILLRARMEASEVTSSVGQIQKSLQGLTLPKGLTNDLEKELNKLGPLLKDYQKQLSKGFSNKKDLQNFNALKTQIGDTLGIINNLVKQANSKEIKLKVDTQAITKLEKDIVSTTTSLQKALASVFNNKVNADNIASQFDKILQASTKAPSLKGMFGKAQDLFNKQDYAAYNTALDQIKNKILSLKTTKVNVGEALGVKDAASNLDKVKEKIDSVFNGLKVNEGKIQTIELLKNELKQLGIDAEKLDLASKIRGGEEFQNIVANLGQMENGFRETGNAAQDAAAGIVSMKDQVGQLQQSTQYFFSLRNMINLFKRGVNEAIDTVKQLDAAMTETAVVTNFNVGDMWEKLPEYTANANALGASVKDMYEATTLYYQQGLNTEQAMSIATETMKMARIGGLEAADATDKMTAALRGFNMELNETSAQRVNDVYSNLAAKTASDTKELGTAMQRTASIAASAGMSFEGTAAFLAQAIETTREPAENLGTAMKTIVARFTELKKNPLEIVEVDGEEISYNKVDTALQSIGVSLKDANGQFRALDEVFLDISERWDSLTQTQQRYVATTAAGSRQQSRFIAMMSNYDRTVQLMDYANNSAGASAEQFGKTMESLEAKLNKLRNAWDQFLMGIANSSIIKGAVDGLTAGLGLLNKTLDKLSLGQGGLKSVLSLVTAFMGLKGLGRMVNMTIGGLGGLVDPQSSFAEGFKGGFFGGRQQLQADRITNPIVKAIYDLIPHIDGTVANETGTGNYKQAHTDLRGRIKTGEYSVANLNKIIADNGLDVQQEKDLFKSAPGLKQNLVKSLSKLYEKAGMDPEVSKGLIKGFKKGKVSLSELLNQEKLQTSFADRRAEIAKNEGDKEARAFAKQYGDRLRQEGKAQGLKGKELKNFIQSGMVPTKEMENFINQTQKMSPIENFANKTAAAGAALTSLGSSLHMIGASIGKTNPLLGQLATSMGQVASMAGSLALAIPQLIAAGPPAWIAAGAILAIGGAIGVVTYQSEKAKKRAEKVLQDYNDAIDKTSEKISGLESAKDTFISLAKGVDQYNNNVSLGESDYAQYLETSQKIAELAPELIRGYDDQGRAIIETGAALDQLITKEKQYQKEAIEAFTTNGAIDDLIGGLRESDAYKKYGKYEKSGASQEGTEIIGSFGNQINKIRESLLNAGIDFEQISKQLFGREINLINPSKEDIRLLSQHYRDIISLAESQNKELTEKQKTGLQNAFSDLSEGWGAMSEQMQPLSKAIGQYLSLEGMDAIGLELGAEFTESFNKGLESLIMTDVLDGNKTSSEIKADALAYAEGFKHLTQEGSDYANIMKQVVTEQEKYVDSIDDPGAVDNYKDAVEGYAKQLETLADGFDDGTEKGKIFANTIRETAHSIRNYATKATIDLETALNSLSDEFASARGAQERFNEATKDGDYYTAAEGYKSIIETVLDEKNKAADGSLTGWAGADELLGQNFVDNHNWQEIVTQIEKIQDCFEDGQDGIIAFNDLLTENADKLKGLGEVGENGFEFNLENDDLKEYAEVLGMSEEALAGLIDKARQWIPINLGDPAKIRQALEQDQRTMVGESNRLYMADSAFRAEARRQGIRGDDFTKTKQGLEDRNVKFLTVESLTAKNGLDNVLKDIGLDKTEQTLDNTVSVLSKLGFNLSEQQRILDKVELADGKVSADEIERSYNENAYALESPTIAGIADKTGIIATAATAILASMGILTDDAKEKINNSTSKEQIDGLKNTLSPQGGFADLNSRNAARQKVESQLNEYKATLDLLSQGNLEHTSEYKALENAINELEPALRAESQAWEKATSSAQQYVGNINTNEFEQKYLNDNAIEIQTALQSGDVDQVTNTLTKLQNEGKLSAEAMVDLINNIKGLDEGKPYLTALNDLMSTYNNAIFEARKNSNEPFHFSIANPEDLREHIASINELSASHKRIIFSTVLEGSEKPLAFLNQIESDFAGDDIKKKTVIIEAIAKKASGNSEEAEKLLSDEFGEGGKTIEKQIEVLLDGSVGNAGEVKEAIDQELLNINAQPFDVPVDINLSVIQDNINTAFAGLNTPQNLTFGTTIKREELDGIQEEVKAGGDFPVRAKDEASPTISKLTKNEEKWITVNGRQGSGWIFTATVKGNARGRNYSIPAHQTPTFGSAAEGFNITSTNSSKSHITSLVGEEGYEVGWIPSEGRSVIFGANGPEITSFPSDTVIYPHKQSKDIVRRGKGRHATLGSFNDGKDYVKSGGLLTNVGTTGTNNKDKKDKKVDKKVEKAAKTVEDTAKKIGGVSVWWENIARKTEATQRKADKNQKVYEKYLKDLRSTLTKTGTEGQGNSYINNLNKAIQLNKDQVDKANAQLKTLDTGTAAYQKATKVKGSKARTKAINKANESAFNAATPGVVNVSYSTGKGKKQKTKEELVNLEKYIKSQDDTYIVDQAAINSISNKEKRKAVADAANKEVNDLLSKRNKAEDEIQKANEALAKFGEELYNTFFAWETELTKIWNITQKIEQSEANISRQKSYSELLTAQLNAGLVKDIDVFNKETLAAFKAEVKKESNLLKQRVDSISTLQANVQKAMSTADEQQTLSAVQSKLNSNQNITTAKATADDKQAALTKAQNKQSTSSKAVAQAKAELKAAKDAQKKAKKTKSKKDDKKANAAIKAAQKKLNTANAELTKAKKAVKTAQSAFDQANEVYEQTVSNNTQLSETERRGYEEYSKKLQEQIEVQRDAQKYTTFTRNADGTVNIDFNTDALEADKLAGLISSDKIQKIEEYVKNVQDSVKELNDTYQQVTEDLAAMHGRLATLKDEWAGYAKELWDYFEKKSKEDVENLRKLSTSITNALKKLLDEIKRKLDDRRRVEDNAKTESEISKKQQRLAMLRADTSGGHQVEIAQLQQEIASAQQDYQRSLEDQLLDKLQQQADLASEQRERLIGLAEAQLNTINNSAIVDLWMANPEEYRKEIEEAFKNSDYAKAPEAIKQQIDGKFAEFWNGLVTNQDEQTIVESEIKTLNTTVEQIRSYLAKAGLNIKTAKEYDLNAAEAQQQTGASWKDVKEQGGYTAEEFGAAGVSYSNARQAFEAPELKTVDRYAAQANTEISDNKKKEQEAAARAKQKEQEAAARAAQAKADEEKAAKQKAAEAQKAKANAEAEAVRRGKENDYAAALNAVKKLKPANVKTAHVDNLLKLGSATGRSHAEVLTDLVAGKPFTWKNIFKAIIDSKKINRYELVKTWPNGDGTLVKALATLGKPNTLEAIKKHKDFKKAKDLKTKFATGGLADFTGPAWLDGTKAKPELVLNAQDTKNFIALKDILSSAMKSTSAVSNSYGSDAMYEININVDHINNDYDVDKIAERVKKNIVKESGYRNVTQVRKFR